jgi:hypothetical protein
MISHDLATELKDAGWPQGGDGGWITSPHKIVVRSGDRVYAPTLSELIEACGDTFQMLIRDIDKWACKRFEPARWSHDLETLSVGSTAEEAVARLWLAHNKKPR